MRIAVVIPCYRVTQYVMEVIEKIGNEVDTIYCIDDRCPENSGQFIEANSKDSRVKVIYHSQNQGVGGAVITGYKAAIENNADIVIKIDGDGQMDPALIPKMIRPIVKQQADYTKGNRFYLADYLKDMPALRKTGNALLSFMNKFSTGYWDIFDPTNGYTAISSPIIKELPLNKISKRYFFESDMLFHLSILKAVVKDIPIKSTYNGEISSLKINKIINEFLFRHFFNFIKRIIYNYYIRNFTLGSIELLLAIICIMSGSIAGSIHWITSIQTGIIASSGSVMLSALPIVIGFQLLIAFFGEDISLVPKTPISTFLVNDKLVIRFRNTEPKEISVSDSLKNNIFKQKRIIPPHYIQTKSFKKHFNS